MRASTIVGLTALLINSVFATDAANAQCATLTGAGPVSAGDIIALGNVPAANQWLRQDNPTPLTFRSNLRIAFILQPSSLKDGALIVKSQHADADGNLIGAPDWVLLTRDRQIATACTKQPKGSYGHKIPLSRYVNYHYFYTEDYSNTDDKLDNFHTEVGLRHSEHFFRSTDYCLQTGDKRVRSQFMFDERRNGANTFERLARLASDTPENLEDRSFADKPPPPLAGYTAQIVPFVRSNNALSCILSAPISVPKLAKQTIVSVIDVDDAALNWLPDPQRSRTISWQPPATRRHSVSLH